MRSVATLILFSLSIFNHNYANSDQNNVYNPKFLDLPGKASVQNLTIRVAKQSPDMIYLSVQGTVTAKISESGLKNEFREFGILMEVFEDDLITDERITQEEVRLRLPYKEKTGTFVKFSSYSSNIEHKLRVRVADIKANLGLFDKPKLYVKVTVPERTGKAVEKSNTLDIDFKRRNQMIRPKVPTEYRLSEADDQATKADNHASKGDYHASKTYNQATKGDYQPSKADVNNFTQALNGTMDLNNMALIEDTTTDTPPPTPPVPPIPLEPSPVPPIPVEPPPAPIAPTVGPNPETDPSLPTDGSMATIFGCLVESYQKYGVRNWTIGRIEHRDWKGEPVASNRYAIRHSVEVVHNNRPLKEFRVFNECQSTLATMNKGIYEDIIDSIRRDMNEHTQSITGDVDRVIEEWENNRFHDSFRKINNPPKIVYKTANLAADANPQFNLIKAFADKAHVRRDNPNAQAELRSKSRWSLQNGAAWVVALRILISQAFKDEHQHVSDAITNQTNIESRNANDALQEAKSSLSEAFDDFAN